MPRVLKLLIGFGVVAIVFFAWLFTFGVQSWLRSNALDTARKFPGLKLKPVALANTLVSPSWNNTGECSGYLVDLPWAEKSILPEDGGTRGGCVFNNGKNMITMFVGKPNEELDHFYVIAAYRPMMEQKYFGNDPPKNNYEFVKRVLAMTPNSFPRYGGLTTMERDLKLFDQKRAIVRDTGADDVIYSVSTPAFQGFQFSSPNAKASMEVRLYSDKNKVTLQFLTTGKGTPLSQPDINSVVQSVRHDPSAPTIAGGKN